MWSPSIESFNFIESKTGYIYLYLTSKDSSQLLFEIGVIASIMRAPLCGNRHELYELTKPVVFFGTARYINDTIKFTKQEPNDRLRFFLLKNYPSRNRDFNVNNSLLKKIVFSFEEAHPNVNTAGYLCTGTLGRYSPDWSIERKTRYLIGIMNMVSVPSIDTTLDSFGCKTYRKLKEFFPPTLRECLKKNCKRI